MSKCQERINGEAPVSKSPLRKVIWARDVVLAESAGQLREARALELRVCILSDERDFLKCCESCNCDTKVNTRNVADVQDMVINVVEGLREGTLGSYNSVRRSFNWFLVDFSKRLK